MFEKYIHEVGEVVNLPIKQYHSWRNPVPPRMIMCARCSRMLYREEFHGHECNFLLPSRSIPQEPKKPPNHLRDMIYGQLLISVALIVFAFEYFGIHVYENWSTAIQGISIAMIGYGVAIVIFNFVKYHMVKS